MSKIVKISTEGTWYEVSDYSTQGFNYYKEINRIEKPGEMAMVGWFQLVDFDGIVVKEIAEKYVVEIEYAKDKE
jgi:hypothetical protein